MKDKLRSITEYLMAFVFYAINKIDPRRRYIKVPASWVKTPIARTDRLTYQSEKGLYRVAGSLIRDGVLIEARHYYMYKHIAQKYDWPFIKESYDKD